MPQQGIMGAARAMAPNTNMAQNTGLAQAVPMQATRAPQQPQMAADGGILKMANGGIPNRMDLAAQIMRTVNPRARSIYDDVNALPIETLISIYGIDAVREAESLLLPPMKDLMEEVPTEGRLGKYPSTFSRGELRKMEDQGIFGNKSYRDPSQSTYLGGEGIQNVSADVESFIPELENPYEESEDIYSTLALDTAQAPELEDPYAEPEDPLRPKTGFGSNPVYTYETFLEENGLNDVPEAQEMFIKYKNYMNERGPTSNPRVYSPFLDDAPDAPKSVDSGALPSISSMSEELAANTLYPEGIGTATQEFFQKQNANFGDASGGFEPIPYLPSISDNAEQRALEQSFAEQRESNSFVNQLKGGLANTAAIVGDVLTPDPLLEVGAVPNKREVLESQIADINQQILDAEQANDEILVNALTKRKNALMRSINTMEFSEDAGEVLRSIPSAVQNVGSSIYQTFNEQVVAGVDPRLAAANIKASQDAVAARESGNEVAIESEAAREARIDALLNGATEVVPGISTDVSGFFPNLEMENPNIGDSTTPAPEVTTNDNPNKKLPVTDGGEGGAGFGSTDSRIAKMLSDRQKQAESDKWMALAQAGFQIMGSKSPTLLGAIGEGGQAGLKALSASKKGKQAFDADMLKLQTQLDIANIRSQRAGKNIPATALSSAYTELTDAEEKYMQAKPGPAKLAAKKVFDAAATRYDELKRVFDASFNVNPASADNAGGFKDINLT